MNGVILAVEDVLGEVVCRKLLTQERILVQQTVGLRGNTFLRAKALDFNRLSLRVPVVMLTDLDHSDLCPADFVRSWLQSAERAPRFFLRVAVHEVESWVIAHRSAFADFVGVSQQAILPRDTDSIVDPKTYVVQLGRRSRKREIRRALVPAPRSTATVGPGYNRELSRFVREHWHPNEARRASSSLNRTVLRLRELVQ
jgi:hypothetical protein